MSFALWLAFKFWQNRCNRCTHFGEKEAKKYCPIQNYRAWSGPSLNGVAVSVGWFCFIRPDFFSSHGKPLAPGCSKPSNFHFSVLCKNNSPGKISLPSLVRLEEPCCLVGTDLEAWAIWPGRRLRGWEPGNVEFKPWDFPCQPCVSYIPHWELLRSFGQCYRTLLALFPPPHSTCHLHNTEDQQPPEGTPDKRLGLPAGDAFQCERMMFACLAVASVSLQMQEQIVLFPLSASQCGFGWSSLVVLWFRGATSFLVLLKS